MATSGYEEEVVTTRLQEFGQLNLWRSTTAAHWEEIAELIDPASRNTFYYGNYNWPGQKKTDRQVDATGMMALGRFSAILDSLLTPRNQLWHQLASDSTDVMAEPGREAVVRAVNQDPVSGALRCHRQLHRC
jgi:hypothetical protein